MLRCDTMCCMRRGVCIKSYGFPSYFPMFCFILHLCTICNDQSTAFLKHMHRRRSPSSHPVQIKYGQHQLPNAASSQRRSQSILFSLTLDPDRATVLRHTLRQHVPQNTTQHLDMCPMLLPYNLDALCLFRAPTRSLFLLPP